MLTAATHRAAAHVRRARQMLRRFVYGTRAAAAIEFALILPVVLGLFVGASEVSDAVMARRKVETIARTLVDLTSQQPTSSQSMSTPAPANALTLTTLQNMMAASAALMAPGSTATLQMTISAVDVTNNGLGLCCQANVRWSFTQNGTLRPCNTPLTAAADTAAPSATTISADMIPPVIWLPQSYPELIVDVTYTYPNLFSNTLLNFPTMSRTIYAIPRATAGQVIAAGPLTGGVSGQTGAICY